MSDPDFTDNDPPIGTWLSTDFGTRWSAPERISSACRRVNDVAATTSGELVILLTCVAGPSVGQPMVLVRTADGTWLPPERLNAAVWQYSEGKLALVGEGPALRILGLMLAGRNGMPIAYLFSRTLVGNSTVQARPIQLRGNRPTGMRMWYPHRLVFNRQQADGSIQPGVIFTWSSADADIAGIYGLTSLDGGASWGAVEEIIYLGPTRTKTLFAPVAYDPLADRLVVIWTCCADTRWEVAPATHFARWSVPGSGQWWQPGRTDDPLILGSRVAGETVAAQSANSRQVWLAWIEQQQRIEVRSLNLNQVVPIDQYPTAVAGGS